MVKIQECVENCELDDYQNGLCIMNYLKTNDGKNITEQEKKEEEIKAKDIMIKNVEKGFTSGKYNTSDLDSGKNDIIKHGDMT